MIDLNTLVSTALTNAIEQATLPLQLAINAQQDDIIQLSERIAALEQARAATPLTGTVDWANSQPAFDAPATPAAPTEKTILNDMDTLKTYIATVAEQAVEDGIEMHCNEQAHNDMDTLKTYIEQAVEQGISTHCEEAEHNEECDIDSWIERIVERHEANQHDDDDSFEEKVREALRSLVRSL
jgi:hypothetical protein